MITPFCQSYNTFFTDFADSSVVLSLNNILVSSANNRTKYPERKTGKSFI